MLQTPYPFTPKGEAALRQAEHLARRLHHKYIGTEHLLLGLLSSPCLASYVLKLHEVTEERVRELIGRLVAPEFVEEDSDILPEPTPRFSAVLAQSAGEARHGHQSSIGTEHLLMALLKETDSVAVRLLHTMDVNPNRVMVDLAEAMGEDGRIYQEEMEDGGTAAGTPTLDRYSRDLTALAAAGELDPVIGRESERRRMILDSEPPDEEQSLPDRGTGRGKDGDCGAPGADDRFGSGTGDSERVSPVGAGSFRDGCRDEVPW